MPDSSDLSRVTALAVKGYELSLKGHNARAAEKFRLAVEEAEKALPDPDCLVTCLLRHEQLHALLRHASSAAKPADANDALREACLRLLPSVMAVLERRKAAGTLLPGSWYPAEEAYQTAMALHCLELDGLTQASARKNAVALAPQVGVETFIRVAAAVAYMLNNMGTLQRVFVLSVEQIDADYLFVASALDLMAQPRAFDTLLLTGEPGLVRELRNLIPVVSDMDEPETKTLCAAWRRLLRSGVLRTRGVDEGIDKTNQNQLRVRAAAEADRAAGRLQQCALAGCSACESHASQFKRCGACRAVCYCCKEHQVEDWPSHKAACKAARKADPAGASSNA